MSSQWAMIDKKEDLDLRNAVEQSLASEQTRHTQESLKQPRGPSFPTTSSAEPMQNATKLSADPADQISAMAENIGLRLGNEFDPIIEPLGDTLIYIGVPPRSSDQSKDEQSYISKHFDRFFIVRSATLKALQSSVFDKLLGPNACIRAEKRFKKLDAYNKLSTATKSNIKFHLDLRPPSEDDDAVMLITDLTCSYGILAWHRAMQLYDLAHNAVAGTDHFDCPSNPYYPDLNRAREGKLGIDIQKTPLAAEYCSVRHHSGLERLLNAIIGRDPKLDSAPKMWTFAALAKYFGCAQHVSIQKWILAWFLRPGNMNFLQINPEAAYRLGLCCQIPDLAHDAFAILVGEKALVDVSHQLHGTMSASLSSVHGRPFEILDDDERNRIGHAASSLIQRIRSVLNELFYAVEWMNESQEFEKLTALQSADTDQQQIIRSAQESVVQYVKYRLTSIMVKDLMTLFDVFSPRAASFTMPHTKYVLDIVDTYNKLPLLARPFTRSFWHAVSNADLLSSNDAHMKGGSWTVKESKIWEHQNLHGLGEALLSPSDVTEPERRVDMVNDILWSSKPPHESLAHKRPLSESFQPTQSPHETYGHTLPLRVTNPEEPPRETYGGSVSPHETARAKKLTSANTRTSRQRWVFEGLTPFPQLDGADDGQQSVVPSEYSAVAFKDSKPLSEHKREQTAVMDMPTSPGKRRRVSNEHYDFGPSPSAEAIAHYSFEKAASGSALDVQSETLPSVEEFELPRASTEVQNTVPPRPTDDMPTPQQPSSNFPTWSAYLDNRAGQSMHELGAMPANAKAATNAVTTSQFPQPLPSVTDHDPNGYDDWGVEMPENDPATVTGSWPQTPDRRAVQQFSNTNTFQGGDTGLGSRRANKEWIDANGIKYEAMMRQLGRIVQRRALELVYPAHMFHKDSSLPVDLVDHLLCLNDDEWKYLPLTVGGFDDGTGGVFDEAIPNIEVGGFRGGKRGVRKADNASEGSESGTSSFHDIESEAVSTIEKASKLATDGTETIKSYDTSESDTGFDYTDLYGEIQQLKAEQALQNGASVEDDKHGARLRDSDSTIMGADSDVQGQFFGGDSDGDDALDDDAGAEKSEATSDAGVGGGYSEVKHESDEDDDMEIIDKKNL